MLLPFIFGPIVTRLEAADYACNVERVRGKVCFSIIRLPRPENLEAYQAYLQANYFLGRGTGKEDVGKSLAYTDTAINSMRNMHQPGLCERQCRT
jgi:hypothetical protein